MTNMTKQTEAISTERALKLALEALEWNMDYLPSHGHGTSMASKAINALREALTSVPDWASEAKEQPAPAAIPPDANPVEWKDAVWKVWKLARTGNNTIPSHWLDVMRDLAISATPQAQPAQQEPGRNHWQDGDVFERIAAMKKQPAPATELREQEPVKTQTEFEQWCASSGHDYCFDLNEIGEYQWADAQGAYEAYWARNTSPQAQRKPWVGLTDDEILYCVELENPKAIAEEVEAKLREKNT